MLEYARAAYQSWKKAKSEEECRKEYKDFIDNCARLFSYSTEEIETKLKDQCWFLRP